MPHKVSKPFCINRGALFFNLFQWQQSKTTVVIVLITLLHVQAILYFIPAGHVGFL